jgi:hypothetical protein
VDNSTIFILFFFFLNVGMIPLIDKMLDLMVPMSHKMVIASHDGTYHHIAWWSKFYLLI